MRQPAQVAAAPRTVVRAVALRRRHLLARRHDTAESGLGLTVLGLLGMVAVAVGLVGLAISGGLAWGVVALVGGVVVLIAYLDPFG